jgi:hypothetical protein
MSDEFVPLGEQSPTEIAQKLREIGDDETAQFYESGVNSLAEGLHRPHDWLNKGYQYGFVPLFEPREHYLHEITSAMNMSGNETLKNQRINIHLQRFYVHEYPMALTQAVSEFFFGMNVHTVLFTFEAYNQVAKGTEHVAFNQVYEVIAGQDAGVSGHPIFLGINVGSNGIGFTCKTVNVGNYSDQMIINVINSHVVKTGLHLLTTAQPGLIPFVGIARELTTTLANRSKNIPVQSLNIGLDFEKGAVGARLDIGTYIAVQVPHPGTISWRDWGYDADKDIVVRKNLAQGEDAYTLPHNTIMFRVSKYQK